MFVVSNYSIPSELFTWRVVICSMVCIAFVFRPIQQGIVYLYLLSLVTTHCAAEPVIFYLIS